jgi:hypothetical protein
MHQLAQSGLPPMNTLSQLPGTVGMGRVDIKGGTFNLCAPFGVTSNPAMDVKCSHTAWKSFWS